MGKLDMDFTVFQRRDPVTGELETIVRESSARQTSEELNVFQRCVSALMKGYKAKGETAKERSQDLRNRFSQVAKQCESVNTKEQLRQFLEKKGLR